MLLYILLGTIAVLLIILIVVIFLRGKNNGQSKTIESSDHNSDASVYRPVPAKPTEYEGISSRRENSSTDYTVVLNNLHTGGSWRLTVSDDIVIGRDASCDVTLDDERVSRRHAIVFVGKDGLYIKNVSETNSLKVNGQRIDADQRLKPGDELRLGREELRVDSIISLSGDYPVETEKGRSHEDNSGQISMQTQRFF